MSDPVRYTAEVTTDRHGLVTVTAWREDGPHGRVSCYEAVDEEGRRVSVCDDLNIGEQDWIECELRAAGFNHDA